MYVILEIITSLNLDICPRTLSVPRSEQYSGSVARRVNFKEQISNVQGQISEHIFKSNGSYCVYYLLSIFRKTWDLKTGQYQWNIQSWCVLAKRNDLMVCK